MNILITNHSSSRNLGDASILESLIDELKEYERDIRVFVLVNYLDPNFTNTSANTIHFKNPFMLGLKTESLEVYRKANAVIVRGGDYFSNLYGGLPLFNHVITPYPAVLFRKPMAFLGHSFGPFSMHDPISAFSQRLLKTELEHSQLVTVREEESLEHISRLVNLSKCHIVADSAFLLKPAQENWVSSYIADLFASVDFKSLVGINTSALISRFGFPDLRHVTSKEQCYVRAFAAFLDFILDRFEDIAVLLIPHVMRPGNNDLRVSELVFREVKSKKRIRIVRNVLSPRVMKGIIGHLDFFVASRMHAMIHSISLGVPTLCISYSHKVDGLLKSLDLNEYLLDIEELNSDTLCKKFNELMFNQKAARKAFSSASETAKAKASSSKDYLFDWLALVPN